MSEEFDYMSATELRLRIGKKQISPLELTIRSLERAESVQETLNPFYALMADRAVDEAKAAEIAVMSGKKLLVPVTKFFANIYPPAETRPNIIPVQC